jgi:hypothetical protein
MVGTNLPNAPIAIALHDRALQAEGAAPATLANYSHTLTVARPSAIRLAVLRRPRAVDDLRDAPADVSHRTGFPRTPLPGSLARSSCVPFVPNGDCSRDEPGRPDTTDAELVALWLHGKGPHPIRAYGDDVAVFRRFTGKPLRATYLSDLQCYADSLVTHHTVRNAYEPPQVDLEDSDPCTSSRRVSQRESKHRKSTRPDTS